MTDTPDDPNGCIATLILAAFFIALAFILLSCSHNNDQRACENRGGHLVDIGGTHPGWFCQGGTQ